MKKILFVLALILVMLMIYGCQENTGEIEGDDYTDSFLYTNWPYDGKITYCKINTETGTISPLCPDPLCSHSSEACPFYSMVESPIICGRYIYYLSGLVSEWESVTYGAKKLCRFDLESGEFTVIYQSDENNIHQTLGYAGKYIQFCEMHHDGEKSVFDIMLYDRTTGKIKKIGESSTPQSLIAVKGKRLYWQSNDFGFYSTDENYKSRKDGDTWYSPNVTYNNTAMILEPTGEIKGKDGAKLAMYKLSLYDFETQKRKVVFEETPAYPFLYRDKILFFKLCDDPIFLGNEREMNDGEPTGSLLDVYDEHGGKMYICDRDGKNERLLLDITGLPYKYSLVPFLDGKTGADDWVGVVLYSYQTQDDGMLKRVNNTLMLVNINTGEYKIATEE